MIHILRRTIIITINNDNNNNNNNNSNNDNNNCYYHYIYIYADVTDQLMEFYGSNLWFDAPSCGLNVYKKIWKTYSFPFGKYTGTTGFWEMTRVQIYTLMRKMYVLIHVTCAHVMQQKSMIHVPVSIYI